MTQPSNLERHALPGPDDILRVELPNGITVLARENFSSPAVIVDGKLHLGALHNTEDKAGLADFWSSLLTRGTENYSFADLFEEIESNGASLSVSSGGHTTSFDSKSLAEDLPRMLGLLADVLRRPTFPEEHIERVRAQIMTGLQMRQHNTRAMSGLSFLELAYPAHPFGVSTDGYPGTISGITRDDFAAFQRQLGPKDGIIVIVGAIKAEDAVRMVVDAFGDWQNPDQAAPFVTPDATPIHDVREKRIAIPGKSQSDLVLGYIGPRRAAPDFQAARLANSVLGVFGMYGRLGDTVRQKQGLAYYSYSRITGGMGPGPWRVIAGVAPDKVDTAVASIRDEIRRLCDEPVSPEDLSDNKSYYQGRLVLGLETNEGVAGSIMNMELYDLGLDYLHRYSDTIEALTVEDLQQAAQHYLNPGAYALAVAGPDAG